MGTIVITGPVDTDEGEKRELQESRFELLTEDEIENEIQRTEGERKND